MNKASICLFGGALLGAGLTSSAIAGPTPAVTVDGLLVSLTVPGGGYDFGSFAYAYSYVTVDTITFDVLSDGDVQFDMLSYGIFDSYIDSVLFLFTGDTPSYASYIGGNDDIEDGVVDFNGSVEHFDSFLDIFLTPGEYTIAVAAWGPGISVEAAVGPGDSFFSVLFNTGGNGFPDEGQYRLDIFGDVAIPAPGSIAILGLGGLVAVRRRR